MDIVDLGISFTAMLSLLLHYESKYIWRVGASWFLPDHKIDIICHFVCANQEECSVLIALNSITLHNKLIVGCFSRIILHFTINQLMIFAESVLFSSPWSNTISTFYQELHPWPLHFSPHSQTEVYL